MSLQNVCARELRKNGYKNIEHWIYAGHSKHVYIGRWDPYHPSVPESIWRNPFKVGVDGTRQQVIERYRVYITTKIRDNPSTYNLDTLRDKVLGCWCSPEPCHGDVLIDLLSSIDS